LFKFVWSKYICKIFKDSWIESRIRVEDTTKVYDRRGNLKPEYNNNEYIELLKKREIVVKNVSFPKLKEKLILSNFRVFTMP